MANPIKLLRQFLGRLDILVLRVFVTTGEEDHYRVATLHEIHPVSGTIIDAQFRDALSHWLHIPWVAQRQAT